LKRHKKSVKPAPKLHARNKHTGRYDFKALIAATPALQQHIVPNRSGEDSIDFSNPESVKLLNTALLADQYQVTYWDLPEGYLCPAIPGRAEYIHHMADWLTTSNFGRNPVGENITCLDIGVGASLIYPIIGITDYGWSFIGSDIDEVSLHAAQQIAKANPPLQKKVNLRLQETPTDILKGVLHADDKIDLSICNPPFHDSAAAAQQSANRKVTNLTGRKTKNAALNFAGQSNELWCKGGEKAFIQRYIDDSIKFRSQCFWFSTLVSKKSNLDSIQSTLDKKGATKQHTIALGIGNKSSHIVTWTFLSPEEQKEWKKGWS
jgi:23S rRNA (adenine1618-N6)-methyltransferase